MRENSPWSQLTHLTHLIRPKHPHKKDQESPTYQEPKTGDVQRTGAGLPLSLSPLWHLIVGGISSQNRLNILTGTVDESHDTEHRIYSRWCGEETAIADEEALHAVDFAVFVGDRSEERRVGKECRCRWS